MHEVLSSNLNNSCELNIVLRWQVLRLLILQEYKARRGSRMRFYLVLFKKNEIISSAGKWMELEIILSNIN